MTSATLALIASAFSVFATLWGVFVIQRRNMVTSQKMLKTAQDQLEAARAHYRLSFKPFLVTTRAVIINKPQPGLATISISLFNSGIGPAVIVSLNVYVDDKLVDSNNNAVWNNALQILGIQVHGTSNVSYVVNKDYSINPKDSLVLLEIAVVGSEENMKIIEAAFKRSKVIIVYESFYQERFEYDSSRHDMELPTIRQLT